MVLSLQRRRVVLLFVLSLVSFFAILLLKTSATSAQTTCTTLNTGFGVANYSLTNVQSGAQKLWVRIKSTDGSPTLVYNLSGGGTSCNQQITTTGATAWKWVQSSGTFNTTGGTVAVQISTNKAGVGLDCFVLTSDTAFVPTGTTGCAGPQVDTTAPSASFTAPAANATVSGTITVSATASDTESGIQKVTFSVAGNSTLDVVDTTAPYERTLDTSALTNGLVQLTIVAQNGQGLTTIVNRTITVNNTTPPPPPPVDTTPPTVSLTAPASGATVSGTITVSANAADTASAISSVSFFLDGSATPFSTDTTSPYSASWNTTAATNGTHTILAKATDAAGNIGTSASRTVTVSNVTPDTTPPTVSLTAPSNGATVSGTITVSSTATDTESAVASVSYYLDGSVTPFSTDTSSPYTSSWNTATVSNGSHSITAKATDTAGNVGTSAARTVTVSNTVADTTKPTTSITDPSSGATVSGTKVVTANASDNVGVAKVELLIDGVVRATDTTAPYSFSWDTTTYTNASHTLQTRAYDAANNTQTSATVSVTVNNAPPPPPPPSTPKPGDVNLDGKVNRKDAQIVRKNMGLTNATWTQGDLNGDKIVNNLDLAIVYDNWGA